MELTPQTMTMIKLASPPADTNNHACLMRKLNTENDTANRSAQCMCYHCTENISALLLFT